MRSGAHFRQRRFAWTNLRIRGLLRYRLSQRRFYSGEGLVDVPHGDGADARSEPSVLAREAEGLEGDHRESCFAEQEPPHVVIGAETAAPDEIELDGQIDRALRRDVADRQSRGGHRGEAFVEAIEPRLQVRAVRRPVAPQCLRVAEHPGGGDLLGPGRPRADVAEEILHGGDDRLRAYPPTDPQA